MNIIDRDVELDEFLVLGCDGVFDVLMNNELALVVKSFFAETEDIAITTSKILELCLEKGSEDNMTIIGQLLAKLNVYCFQSFYGLITAKIYSSLSK